MHSIIIADGLTNDLCGIDEQYQNIKLNIGYNEIARLFGEGSKYGKGILPTFLRMICDYKKNNDNFHLVIVKNKHRANNGDDSEIFNQLGPHDIEGTSGNEFVDPVREFIDDFHLIETDQLAIPIEELQNVVSKIIDSSTPGENVKFFITGVHTEKRIFQTAYTLKNILGYKNVAVSPHMVGSSNRDAHFNAFKYSFPDSLIEVVPDTGMILEWIGLKTDQLDQFDLQSCQIEPDEITDQMSPDQKKIIESLCMHWTKAELKTLSGGFSGSLLFLANGWIGKSSTEPMVIKVDKHGPIRKELQGYEKVKDLLGKHVPSIAQPVSSGELSGISMELATMEGTPDTLQDYFENAINDSEINQFVSLLNRTLNLMVDRTYSNTVFAKNYIPYRQFLLHIERQEVWLKRNLDSILIQSIGETKINADVVRNMFNVIRKNDDGVSAELCISHGDLNLANIICDSRENIWIIDWTYTTQHPIEMDFTKLENDIKFVISKNFNSDDFSKMKIFEEFLLSTFSLPELSKLSEKLSFVKWDLRFKKIYLSVREIRRAYSSLKKENDWLVYSIALLKYAIHTLGFDKSRGRGECEAIQLWYALASAEILVYKLIADDFHLKIRGSKPDLYPARQRISIDESNWKLECPDYNPPYFVDQSVLDNDRSKKKDGWAHGENKIEFEQVPDINKEIVTDSKGYPLNPRGRTGLAGRGLFGRWGPNPYIVLVVSRLNQETNNLELLVNDSENEIRLTENFADFGESLESTALEYIKKIFNIDLKSSSMPELYHDYLYDNRQTDNAWLIAKSYLIFFNDDNKDIVFDSNLYKEMKWVAFTPEIINQFSSNRASILRSAVDIIGKENYADKVIVDNILNRTG